MSNSDDDILNSTMNVSGAGSSDTITITLPSYAATVDMSNYNYTYNNPYSTGTYTITSNIGTTIGSNGTWSTTTSTVSPNTTFNSSNNKTIMSIPYGQEKMVLEKDATLEVNGSVKINGLDLEERLSTIEKVLQIPQRDVTMESKYPKLKKLYEEYMRELEKLRTWDALKESK